jgi:hypothetical protein
MANVFKRKVVSAYFLSIVIVLIMSITSFAGAIQSNSGGAVGGPAAPGEPGAEPGIVDDGVITDDIEVDDLDDDTRERLADRILGDDSDTDAKPDSELGDFPNLIESENNLDTFDNLIESTFSNYMAQAAYGSEVSADSYSTTLYDTVSDYLNGGDEKTFVDYPTQFAEDGFTPDREEVSERTLTSKTFTNEDGTSTAILSQDALHYLDAEGEYQDLDLNIRTSANGGYENLENNLKSYFSEDSSVVAVDIDGNSRFTWIPVEQVYVDQYDLAHSLSYASASEGVIDGNTITYEGTFADTTEEYIVKSDHLKHNLYLSAFPESAANGKYLSYIGKVDLAEGLILFADGMPVTGDLETAGAIDVVDASGKVVYMLPPPFAVEAENIEENVGGTYSIDVVDGEVFLSMNTPVSWLADSERTYPVVIDPVLYTQLNNQMCGYTYHYYYNRTYYSGSSTVNNYWYNYYPGQYDHYYTYLGGYGYEYYYSTYYYTYQYTRRAWFEWNTSAVPDTDTIKQIDFHGVNWRTYNIYDTSGYDMLVTIRGLKKDPMDAPYASSSDAAGQAKQKAFFEELVNGSVYNSSVDFGIGYGIDVDVYALGGLAKTHMQNQLSSDVFRMAMHRTVELPISYPGYGYFDTYEYYDPDGENAYLYVTYDPCPTAPRIDTGGPYRIPEGTTGLTLDASGTLVCGSSALYMWDTDEDGIYDKTSSSPTIYWNKNWPDDETVTLKLKVMDLTLNLNSEGTTTLEVWNVHPRIVTPSTTISGYEGTTITFPAIEFTDPGVYDTHTYEYDFDGDNVIDASGSTTTSGGKLYVPSQSYYFCDNADWVNLTVWDSDGGYSDSISVEVIDADYDGHIQFYQRDAQPLDTAYGYISESNYYTMYLYRYTSMLYYDNERRSVMKFNARSLPSTFTATNITLTTYMSYFYNYNADDFIKMGVNDLTTDIRPTTGTPNWVTVFQDADDSNILDNEEYKTVTSDDVGDYISLYLDPGDFNNRDYSNWYGVAFDFYEPSQGSSATSYNYCYFYGGQYTTLEVTDGTSSYKLQCYTNSNTGYGAHGYVYATWYPERDLFYKDDEYTYNYIDDYIDAYNGDDEARSFIKFGPPSVDQNKIVDTDIRMYTSWQPTTTETFVADLDYDPETANAQVIWDDCDASNIYNDTVWIPDSIGWVTCDLDGQDYLDKLDEHEDWYGVGFKKVGGTGEGFYFYSDDYPKQYGYAPKLDVKYRTPYKLAVEIQNVDPVMDTSNMVVTPTDVDEGDTVSVSGITYTDDGCDTHQYRVIVDLGTGVAPSVVKDWTDAEDGTLDFTFNAGDDDPDDSDGDDSVDDITVTIELVDDDYTPDLHYDSITLVCTHYEYYYSYYDTYYYTPQKPWGVYRNLVAWDEMTATWNNYPRSNATSTPEDTLPAHTHLTGSAYYGYFEDEWEITDIMRDWLDGTYPNYGLRVQPTTVGKDPFYLYSTDYSAYAPYLKVDYVEPELDDYEHDLNADTKDTLLREGYYADTNAGSYSYFVYAWNYYPTYTDYYGYYKEGNGLIEFDLTGIPPETDLSGIDTADITLTISNVAPELDETTYKYMTMDGEEVDAVLEGTEFLITDIIFTDPAAGYDTETFDYRIDMNDGSGYGPWAEGKAVTPGGYSVVPPEYEDADAPSYTSSFFGYYYYTTKRYMQWIDGDDLSDDAKLITHIGWKPTWYEYYLQYEWTAHFGDLRIYMNHLTGGLVSSTYSSNYGSDRTLVFDNSLDWYHAEDSTDWMFIELERPFVYNGRDNLVMDFLYDDYTVDCSYTYAVCMFQYDSGSDQQLIYSYASTDTSGYGPYTYSYVYKFLFDDSFSEPYGIIPPIEIMYPDDNPTGTSSDEMSITIQIKDDDGGLSTNSLDITVENVPPSITPGRVLIDGELPAADVLIVRDEYISSSYDVESKYEDALETFFKYADVITSSSSQFTAANMANYDFVIYLMNYRMWYRYRYYSSTYTYDYFSNSEATTLKTYLESYAGKLWFVNPYAMGYNYVYPSSYTPPSDPSYKSWFFDMFGVEEDTTYTHYLSSSGSNVFMRGDEDGDGWFETTEVFNLAYPDPYFSYGYYASTFELSDGTNELEHTSWYDGEDKMFSHKEDSSWGSKAVMSGFDFNQIAAYTAPSPGPTPTPKDSSSLDTDDKDPAPSFSNNPDGARENIMYEILKYFGIPDAFEVTIDEGQEIELENFDIVDPAEGVDTESFQFEIDWGDGEETELYDVEEGINMQFDPAVVIPEGYEEFGSGTSSSRYPFCPRYSYRRYFQIIPNTDFDMNAGTLNSISFRPDEYYYYLDDYWRVRYYNLKVTLSHTTNTVVDYYAYNNHGSDQTLVYDGTGSWFTWTHPANSEDWMEIPFDNSDFDYDGDSSLMLEISYTSYSYSYTGSAYAIGYFDAIYKSGVYYPIRFTTSATSNYLSYASYYPMIVRFGMDVTPPTPTPPESYTHLYRDDPAVGDSYEMVIHVYDDDLGHGTFPMCVTVNNVEPNISPNTVLRPISCDESGSPNVPLPAIDFDDPATQYDIYDPNEVWTGVWDINNDGILASPDVFIPVPQGAVSEIDDHSYGTVPEAMATVNDDFYGTITFYLFDDDMSQDLSSSTSSTPDSVSTTITVYNTAPVASIEVYIPMEVRLRMTGREYHDTKVIISQENPSNSADVLTSEMTIERVPGKPKENPYLNGDPAEPLLVKVEPWRTLDVTIVLDGRPDPNDPVHPNGYTHGSNTVSIFLDFPNEDDYDPKEADQSTTGHDWNRDVHFNANINPTFTHTFDASDVKAGKKAYLVGMSYDDASDDAQFNWMVTSGSAPLPYTRVTYYNDGSPPAVNGPFRDVKPSPFHGTAPIIFYDVHEFTYSSGFGVQLYVVDDDLGVSSPATLTIP